MALEESARGGRAAPAVLRLLLRAAVRPSLVTGSLVPCWWEGVGITPGPCRRPLSQEGWTRVQSTSGQARPGGF